MTYGILCNSFDAIHANVILSSASDYRVELALRTKTCRIAVAKKVPKKRVS